MPTLPEKASLTGDFAGPYQDAEPVEDPTTDVSADVLNAALCNVAMMSHTAPRAVVLFTGITYTSGTMSITPDDHDALWGSGTAVRPAVTQAVSATYVLTWAATQTDELGDTHTLNIRFPDCVAYGVSTLVAKVISWTANTITIQTTSSGSANALNGTKIKVWWS